MFSYRANPTRGFNLLAELQSLMVRLARLLEAEADKELMEACTVDGKTARASGRSPYAHRLGPVGLWPGGRSDRGGQQSQRVDGHPLTLTLGRPRKAVSCPLSPLGCLMDIAQTIAEGDGGTC